MNEYETIPEEQPVKEKGFFKRLCEGLSKTRQNITYGLSTVFSGFSTIDDDFYDELEETLVMADLGVTASSEIIEELRGEVADRKLTDVAECRNVLLALMKERLALPEDAFAFEETPSVVLVVGVNGVGKTTTIGKLAGKYRSEGKTVLLAAADTFRAAAGEQLKEWSHRAGVEVISGQEGSDPAAVIFDALQAAKARKADILLCDTAGRLHNKKNLMNELHKIRQVIAREYEGACVETLLVLDGTTGQNALSQAREFIEAVGDVSGIVITKLDGTAKGGMAFAIRSMLGVPIKFIGVGEQIGDLQKFDPDAFVDALFSDSQKMQQGA